MNDPQIIINSTEKPNSFEFGKSTARFKLFFDTPEELKEKIDNLVKQGLLSPKSLEDLKGGNE